MTARRRTTALLTTCLLGVTLVATTGPAGAAPPYLIDSAAPAAGVGGVAYSHTFTGSPTGATYAVTAGTLPDGLTLDASTGVLSGTPTTPGTATGIDVTATWNDRFAAITAGGYHTCGILTSNGSADCWGLNNDGEADDQTGPYTAITAGGGHTCGILASNGSVDCWGNNLSGEADDQTGPYTAINAGGSHTCGILTSNGSVDCWGRNIYGQADDQTGLYTAITAGYHHTCGILTADGSVDCWGGYFEEVPDQPGPVLGADTQTFDLTIAPAPGTISGTVTADTGGAPLAGIRVRLYDGTTGIATVATDAAGNYTLPGLDPTGTYRVRFADTVSGFYATEYNGNTTKFNLTPVIAVTAGATTTTDAALATAAAPLPWAVTGTVTADTGGAPLPGITISAYQNGVLVNGTVTNAAGQFTIGNLPATGTWTLRYRDATSTHTREFWNNQPTLAKANALTSTPAATTTANAALVAAS